MMENNGQSDCVLFEVNPIELGRFDPDSQDLDFILCQLLEFGYIRYSTL